jgi:hypothetical protein
MERSVPKMSESKLLADEFLYLEPFAVEVDRDPRTVRRWLNQPDGLPYTKLGNRILIHLPTAREWLIGRMRHPNRRRGNHAQKAERVGMEA